ncbi:MAG: SusC/RagA family TonB-linked outer membrane protein [Maribacter sp.]|nr:SusC/RagA family TonB-linked outer membrane protein [Maribacter sp.]
MIKKQFLGFCVLLLSSSFILAQNEVTGTVSDTSGPLPGASVVVKGTSKGTTTDFDGNYSISLSSGDAILVFSYIGYSDQEIPVNNQNTINVTLEESARALDEVVVTALGFTVDRKTLGATYSKINADDARQSGETGVINSLAGKASGVKISRANGDPGAGSSIQIRGANTIGGNTQPLIVVDGIAFSNENANGIGNAATGGVSQQSRLNDINQDDIESMTILKGASAAAVWGSQAANGVIVITTKKGRNKDKIDVSYNAIISFDEISDRHPLQTNYGQGTGGNWGQNNSRSWGDRISDRAGGNDEFNTSGQYFEAQDGSLYYPITAKNSQRTFVNENFDQVFRTGNSINHSISVSGAGEKGNIYLSFGKLDNKGIIKSSFYDKINASLNATYRFNDWLSIKGKANYINIKSNRIQQSSNVNGLYLGLLRSAPDVDNRDYIGTYFNSGGTPTPLRQRSYRNTYGSKTNSAYNNPGWTVNELKNLNNVDRYLLNLETTFKPTDWLSVIARGGVDNYIDFRSSFFPMFSSGSTPSGGQYYTENRDLKNLTFDFIGRSNFDLTEDLNLSLTLGYGHNNKKRNSIYAEAKGFIFNTRLKDFETLATEANRIALNSKSFFKSDRFFGVAAFNYKDVFLNFSGAYETFSSASEGVFYPAADVSWNFSDSKVFEDSFLSSGKLRASFGQVGVAPQRHRFNTTFEGFTYEDYSDPIDITYFGGGFKLNDDLGNPNLKPEIKTEYELGTDLTFFNNRLGLNFTYYQNEIDDVLLDVTLSPSTGHNNQYRNAGKLENKGLEIDFNFKLLQNEEYNLSLFGNFNNNKSKVLDLAGTDVVSLVGGSITSAAIVGEPMSVLYGSRILRNSDGTPDLDANGFLQQDSEQGVIGDPNPDWRGGLGMSANYKKLNFNVLFETSQGNDYAERTRFILGNFGTHSDVGNTVSPSQDLVDVNGDIHPAGTPTRGNIADFGAGPVLLNEPWYRGRGGGFGSSPINELAIRDASWVRLRELSLGYTLNSEEFRKKTKLSSIDFTFTGRNLALWSDVVGVDPEINQSGVANGFGIDYFTNPTTKSFVFSIKLNY